MNFLTATANFSHRTPIPSGATIEKSLLVFEDHDFLIRLDPELAHYEACPPDTSDAKLKTKKYTVTDHMHTLPRGLWDTTVSFTAEITNTKNGIEWIIRAPMGLVQKSLWSIIPDDAEGESATGLVLVEDVEITCSRLLLGVVKGKCEQNWRGIHERFIERVMQVKE